MSRVVQDAASLRAGELEQLGRAHTRAVHEFEDVDRGVVDRCFDRVAHSFDGAPVRVFVPVLVARRVRLDLRAARLERVTAR